VSIIDLATSIARPMLSVGCGGNRKYPQRTIRDVNIDITVPTENIPNFVRADAQHLPFRDKVFERIHASHIIEHLEDPYAFIRECKRVADTAEILCPHYLDPNAYIDLDHKHVYWRGGFVRNNPRLQAIANIIFRNKWIKWASRKAAGCSREVKITLPPTFPQ